MNRNEAKIPVTLQPKWWWVQTTSKAEQPFASSVLLPFMLSDWSIMGTWTRSLIYHPIHSNSCPDVLWPLANRAHNFANTQNHAVGDHYKTRWKISCHLIKIKHIVSSLHVKTLKNKYVWSTIKNKRRMAAIPLLMPGLICWFSPFSNTLSECVWISQTNHASVPAGPLNRVCGRRLALSEQKVTRFQTWASWQLNPGVVWGLLELLVWKCPQSPSLLSDNCFSLGWGLGQARLHQDGPRGCSLSGEGPLTECRIL